MHHRSDAVRGQTTSGPVLRVSETVGGPQPICGSVAKDASSSSSDSNESPVR